MIHPHRALLLASVLAPGLAFAQDPVLKRALEAEKKQVALIARLMPAVAAVSKPGKPGGGSGVIIDPRGYVLTNFHVSGTSRVLLVGLNDGKQYKAHLLGIDPGGDISLLKLDDKRRKTWPYVPLGDSDKLRQGERVYAMGNPFGLAEDFTPTVTQGVVSGIHRYRAASGSSDLVYGDCIQIDASINPGNSGGPLFSSTGKLLGINGLGGFRPDRGRVNVGVGFAASINQIKHFLLDLRAGLHINHGTMNATVRDEEIGGGKTQLIVDAITRSGRAYKAGLRLRDIVRRFNGVEVKTQNRLLTLVSRLPTGRRITLTVARPREDGKGYHTVDLKFRLEPLFAGPPAGRWKPNPKLVALETRAILEKHRATKPPREWTMVENVRTAKGRTFKRVTRVKGRQIRVEVGKRVEVYGETAWLRTAAGKLTKLPAVRRDALAGQIESLAALAVDGGEGNLSSMTFTGGEVIHGRSVIRIEARDVAGRRRLLYLNPTSYFVVGQAYPMPGDADRWVEESIQRARGETRIRRVDFETGELLEESRRVKFRYEKQDAALFRKGSGR